MLQTKRAYGGMVTAPHHLASQAGLGVLKEGGNAIEAMVAAAAAISVVYPHMNALGGDNFWLIHVPGQPVRGIDACGGAAAAASIEAYKGTGHTVIPGRGPKAALTVAGAVSGWQRGLDIAAGLGGTFKPDRLFEDAIRYAEDGIAVPSNLAANTVAKRAELEDVPGFAEVYLTGGDPVGEASRLRQPRLAETLRRLAKAGLDDFYRGDIARSIAADLARVGSPISADDLARHHALDVTPLSLDVAGHRVFNMPPPTQGLASLILLGIYERLGIGAADTAEYVHGLIEATKQAFRIRDTYVTDPASMSVEPEAFLSPNALADMAADIDRTRAAPWPDAGDAGDTVWLGAVDRGGVAVSFIQSIYWEFGSGVILDETGITWQNRGTSFSLDAGHINALAPGRRPFHTIQPALAKLSDGRIMPYGTMGGEGQPQTQAMLFTRHVLHGADLQTAVTAPRWLLGRTWGAETTSLRIENRFDPAVFDALRAAGHPLEVIGAYDEVMGHAGALVHHPNRLIEGAADPRSDGAALGF